MKKEVKPVMPVITVMRPKVINVDGPSLNVASEGIGYNTELGVIIQKMDDVDLDYTREDGK
jgi:hypothetical protein